MTFNQNYMRFVILLLLLFSVLSCNEKKFQVSESNRFFTPTEEELYSQCRELHGLGDLVIDHTTYNDVLRRCSVKSNFAKGAWNVPYVEAGEYIKTKCPHLKQINVSGYNIGKIELQNEISLAFLNDTLVAIELYNCYDQIEGLIKAKYGDGSGHLKWFYKTRGNYRDADYYHEQRKDELRVWENHSVRFEYIENTDEPSNKKSEILNVDVLFDMPSQEDPTKVNFGEIKARTEEMYDMLEELTSIYESTMNEQFEKQDQLSLPQNRHKLTYGSDEGSYDYTDKSYKLENGVFNMYRTNGSCYIISKRRYATFKQIFNNVQIEFYKTQIKERRASI